MGETPKRQIPELESKMEGLHEYGGDLVSFWSKGCLVI